MRCPSPILAAVLLLPAATPAGADVRLPSPFGDHMVLQRDLPIPVWGWADPGEGVTVTLDGRSRTATAGADGRWSLRLDPHEAGGPYTLTVRGKNTLERSDVLVGEVWLCSGQSNMAMTVSSCRNFIDESKTADIPRIRMFTVARKTAGEPQVEAAGEWKVCTPQTVGSFSATAYFFGRRLHQELKVPIGLLHSSWGGTPIQAWTSWKTHEETPALVPLLDAFRKAEGAWDPERAKGHYEKQLAEWKSKEAQAKSEGRPFKDRRPQPPQDPRVSQNSPARLYNAMIAPLIPYAIRGVIWYQGESNAGNAALYGHQLRAMIEGWRKDWGQGCYPFISVQLPNFMAPQQHPVEEGWASIREQFLKSLSLTNVGMAITIDIGEAGDIHPKNKQDVGFRLAQWALAKTYGKDIVPGGPLYRSMRREGASIILEFDHIGTGLVAKGGEPLRGFAIAGPDKNFVWGEGKIAGRVVTVSNPDVKEPVAVRYAWANNPICNLFNAEGFPASPFRTDSPGIGAFDPR